MTDRDRAMSTAHPHNASPDEGPNAESARSRASAPCNVHSPTVTHRDAPRGFLARWLDSLTPPEPWTHRPPSLAALWRYARRGGWTGPTGPARRLGVWWCRLLTLPVSFICYYVAWTTARPGRTFTVALLWAILMQVRPLRLVADLVLPWPAWPWGGAQ